MGNFNFPKVWWGEYRLVGGGEQLTPLAPMVATALNKEVQRYTVLNTIMVNEDAPIMQYFTKYCRCGMYLKKENVFKASCQSANGANRS